MGTPVKSHLADVLNWILDITEGIILGGGTLAICAAVLAIVYHTSFTGSVKEVDRFKSIIQQILLAIFVFQIAYFWHLHGFPKPFHDFMDSITSLIASLMKG